MNRFVTSKPLDGIITSFDDWSQPLDFYPFILNCRDLTECDKELFKEIWLKAGSIELWSHADLALGCKICANFIRNNYTLSETANDYIVRALAYQWR